MVWIATYKTLGFIILTYFWQNKFSLDVFRQDQVNKIFLYVAKRNKFIYVRKNKFTFFFPENLTHIHISSDRLRYRIRKDNSISIKIRWTEQSTNNSLDPGLTFTFYIYFICLILRISFYTSNLVTKTIILIPCLFYYQKGRVSHFLTFNLKNTLRLSITFIF